MSIRNTVVYRMRCVLLWLVLGLGVGLLWDATSWAVSSQLKAIVVDRFGNQHEVEKFTYQERLEIEYYVGGQRRIVSLLEIDRMHLEGEHGDEEQTIVVTLRTGRRETGSILSGASVTPHADAVGGGAQVPYGRQYAGDRGVAVGYTRHRFYRSDHPVSESLYGLAGQYDDR